MDAIDQLRSEEMFRDLIQNTSEGILMLDREWNIRYVNPFAEQMLNRRADDLVGKNIWQEFPESVGNTFYKAYRQARLSGKSAHVEDFSTRLNRWIQVGVYPFQSGIAIYFHDFTGQRAAEKKAKENEDRYRMFLERITDGFIALDKDFRYTYVNKRISELIQRDPESLIGKNVWEVFPEAVGSYTYKAFQTAMREQRFISNMDYFEPLNLWQENYIYPSPEGLSVFIKDISERKKLEAQLLEQERTQQLQLVVSSLEAQEKERTSIGIELHDNVNQIIVATKVMLAHLRDNPHHLAEITNTCIGNLEKVIAENRRIAHELVTPDLQHGLIDELTNLVHAMFSTGVIRTTIEAEELNESLLSDKMKLAAYRIAQEQFTNVIKHAKAKHVVLTMATREDHFIMTIADDGKGVDVETAERGIGLRNIDARTRVFGGMMKVESAAGKGFRIEIQIPL